MSFLKKAILINTIVILVLVSLTTQVSLRTKREEGPSETDITGVLDESLRLDHMPVNDETELASIENDIKLTPDESVVESTPPNETPEIEIYMPVTDEAQVDESESGKSNSENESNQEESTNENSESEQTDMELTTEPTETTSSSESETDETTEDTTEQAEGAEESEITITETIKNEEPELNETTTDATDETEESKEPDETDDSEHLVDNPNEDPSPVDDEETEHFIDDPSDDQLLQSKKVAEDYEIESQTTTKKTTEKTNVWFKPTRKTKVNDTFIDESHISANCPSLNCEFGYKTDLYGKPICACFNPCYEKKCGTNVCKIEKLTEDKFIGACYDPTKIERPLHCHLPLATGTCKNYTSRFYFNSFSQKCSHFIFTGCNGNQNNFDTWEKCEMECNTCSLPAVHGPCHGNIIRYHYDPLRRECVAFNWGGCKGNENNFSTRKHCEDSCIFRKEGALFLHGMPVRAIRKYHRQEQNQEKRA